MSAAADDLQPPVEGGVLLLLLEENVPFLEETGVALLVRRVVPIGGGEEGPDKVVGGALVQPSAFLLTVSDVAGEAGDPLVGRVDDDPGVLLHLDGGQGRGAIPPHAKRTHVTWWEKTKCQIFCKIVFLGKPSTSKKSRSYGHFPCGGGGLNPIP